MCIAIPMKVVSVSDNFSVTQAKKLKPSIQSSRDWPPPASGFWYSRALPSAV